MKAGASLRRAGGALACFRFLAAAVEAPAPQARVLRVSPEGPLRSLAEARDELRQRRESGEAVRVVVEDGLYFLDETLRFGPEDGGEEGAPVRYEAAPGARPVISGGRRIEGFVVGEDGVWVARTDPARPFGQLWVNGRRAVRALSTAVNPPPITATRLPTLGAAP